MGVQNWRMLGWLVAGWGGLSGFATAAEGVSARPLLAQYFATETRALRERTAAELAGVTPERWPAQRAQWRAELQEMLGLLPYPEKTDLKPVVTGRVEHAEFFVEKVHFQSMPGLYVTGNVYVPRAVKERAPAILYVCGHVRVAEGKVSFGNKANYQHHGAWFARHGFICLIIDTIQLGEIEGLHHGTHREGMWWWNSRGYTPEGVEAWNCIRALDYLQARADVDGDRMGMTGRSGGGAYTWFTTALDERVKVAVPVAGITDLKNHVVDGCVAGHCDCMFMVNTHRWDYAKMAALVAPRPLLIANSDKDGIFPLDGVIRVHGGVARVYKQLGAAEKLGLLITEGPHKDTQDLQVPAFRWFNRFLRNDESLIRVAAEKFFKPAELRVLAELPADQRTTRTHEFFVAAAAPRVPANADEWAQRRGEWLSALRTKAFAGWPTAGEPLRVTRVRDGAGTGVGSAGGASGAEAKTGSGAATVTTWEFTAQGVVRLPLAVHARGPLSEVKRVYLRVVEAKEWSNVRPDARQQGEIDRGEAAVVFVPAREWLAAGLSARDQVQVRRRYMLLGQTQDGMTVWDIGRAVAALRSSELFGEKPVYLQGARHQAVNALYAALFADGLAGVELEAPPASHHAGPDYLNVLRFLDVPQALAMAAERVPVKLTGANPEAWTWARQTLGRAGLAADRIAW